MWRLREIRSGPDEPSASSQFPVEANLSWIRANKTEYPWRRHRRLLPSLAIDDVDRPQVPVTVHPPDGRVGNQFDIGGLLNPMHQVAGHVLVQVIAADQEYHLAGVPGEKDGRLAGGIAATHNHHLGSAAQLGLG